MRLATEHREPTDERLPSAPRPTRLGGTDIFRGALVILTAVAVGGFVVSRGLDDPADTAAGSADTSEVDPASAGIDDSADGEGDGEGDGTVSGDEAGATGSTTAPGDGLGGAGGQTGTEGQLDDGSTTDATTAPGVTTGDTTAESTTTTVAAGPRPADQVRVLVLNGAGAQGIAARGSETLEALGYTMAAPKNADSLGPSVILHIEGYELEAAAVAEVFSAGLETLVAPLDDINRPVDDIQGAHVVVVIGDDGVIPVP